MVSIILVVLFICQLLSFFLIMILNSKLAKFKDLEARQEKVIREMDDAIGAYLMEMKEENNRLIEELTAVKQAHTVKADIQPVAEQQFETKQSMIQEKVENVETDEECGRATGQVNVEIEPKEFADIWNDVCDGVYALNRTRRRTLGQLIYAATKKEKE